MIVALAVVWKFTADEGPTDDSGWLGKLYDEKADPGTTNFVPRPDWYFYFLFYLLRIFKWPDSVILGTVGIPTILLILLLAAVPRREPRAAAAAAAGRDGRGVLTIASMGVLTYKGATAKEALAPRTSSLVPTWAEEQGFADNEEAVEGAEIFAQVGLHELPHVPRRRNDEPRRARPVRHRQDLEPRRAGFADYVADPSKFGNTVMPKFEDLGSARRTCASSASSSRPPGIQRASAMSVFLGITGASGAPYAARLVDALAAADCEVGICASAAGIQVLATELYGDPRLPRDEVLARFTGARRRRGDRLRPARLHGAVRERVGPGRRLRRLPVLDGDGGHDRDGRRGEPHPPGGRGRAEGGRKLVLVPRETPLSTIHLENLLKLRQAARSSSSRRPGFYHGAETIDDLVDFVAARCLAQLGLDQSLVKEWGDDEPAAVRCLTPT